MGQFKHGFCGTRLYREWRNMLQRTSYAKDRAYHRYGGRGIKVCTEWTESFDAFLDWAISSGYRDDLTLERIDNDGDYEPGNCCWSKHVDQQNNRNNNRLITIGNETWSVADWARLTGIRRETIYARLNLGWTPEQAIATPIGSKRVKITREFCEVDV